MQRHPDNETRLACDVSVWQTLMDDEQLDRHRHVVGRLGALMEDPEALERGYRFRLPASAESIELVAEFISRERLCCPFLKFALEVPARGDRLVCEISGPQGTQELLAGALGLADGRMDYRATSGRSEGRDAG